MTSATQGPIEPILSLRKSHVERGLDRLLRERTDEDLVGLIRLRESMRHSALAGGKRLRPALVMLGAEAVGGCGEDVLPVAMALELVHTYSLVHDDLPAMDDDDLRRGKPTCHIAFDEPTAILAGDGLLTLAFEVLADDELVSRIGAHRFHRLVIELSRAAGRHGMVGGQMIDIGSADRQLDLQELTRLHQLKTGALICASVVMGAIAAGASDAEVEALRGYGQQIGLGFQVVDDILDVTVETAQLGKPGGSDERNGKSTFVTLLGLDGARQAAARCTREAKAAIADFGHKGTDLCAVADFVEARSF